MKVRKIIILSVCLFSLAVVVSEHLIENSRNRAAYAAAASLYPAGLNLDIPADPDTGEQALLYTVPPQDEVFTVPETIQNPPFFTSSILLNNDILAFYGSPRSKRMGILGQYSLPKLEPKLLDYVNRYKEASNGRGVIPALYIIYGMCWPKGKIGYLSDSTVKKYIDYAAKRGWYVFIDHQIGKYTVKESVNTMLPYLQYPNVHLAIDPEWRTTRPMEIIGSVTGDEINEAQQMIEDYMNEHNYPGSRMLVVHQFKPGMITSRRNVRSTFSKVNLLHVADGFGNPALKRLAYRDNAKADNIPLKGFKLFFHSGYEWAGYDSPLMTPQDVYALDPHPYLIMYQ